MDYGFILTRHVNSEVTNKYWNQSVKLIRTHYPLRKIIIIDDNSNYKFVKADHDYQNLEVIQSEFPKRGELLPYVYFLKYKWFDNAVILHDSIFIHKKIPFENINIHVLPLWHHNYDKENLGNLLRISGYLTNNYEIKKKLTDNKHVMGMPTDKNNFDLCFGAMAFVNLNFLTGIENKYKISNLVHCIRSRKDRCGFERIIGLLFSQEYPLLKKARSLFGNIHNYHRAFRYHYNNYLQDFNNNRIFRPFTKVWTGR
jgi:hypothetical protein